MQTEDRNTAELGNKIEDVLVAIDWQRLEESGRWSKDNPEGIKKSSPNYKEKKNPLGKDGRVQKRFSCQSKYNFVSKGENLKNIPRYDDEDGEIYRIQSKI